MFVQITVGTCLMLLGMAVAGFSFWGMEVLLARANPWFLREPHRPKMMLALVAAGVWSMWLVTVGVWIWAIAFRLMGLFPTMEQAMYFALVSFTTLGYGDVLLPPEWQLLGGMAAANGFLNFGLLIAILVEALRHVRLGQLEARQRQHPRSARVDALTTGAPRDKARHRPN